MIISEHGQYCASGGAGATQAEFTRDASEWRIEKVADGTSYPGRGLMGRGDNQQFVRRVMQWLCGEV